MRVIGFVLWVIVLVACQHKPEPFNLIGHWHVHYPDNRFETWDISDSFEVNIDKNSYWGMGYTLFYNFRSRDTLVLMADGYLSEMTYNYLNDTLFLSDRSYAIKTDTNQCDLPEEFFGELHITVELANSEEAFILSGEEIRKTLFSDLYIGKPKPYIKQFPKDTFLIEVERGDFFIDYTGIQEFVEEGKAMLPRAERDNITIVLSPHKQAPAQMVDSIERIVNKYYPNLKIMYACLPGEKQYVKKSVFTSLKNEFAKPADQSATVIIVDMNEEGQVKWALKENTSKNLTYYSLEETEHAEKLKRLWQEAKTNKQKPGIAFTFADGTTFQHYLTAQTTIKRIINQSGL